MLTYFAPFSTDVLLTILLPVLFAVWILALLAWDLVQDWRGVRRCPDCAHVLRGGVCPEHGPESW
jgi:hypothetical protein